MGVRPLPTNSRYRRTLDDETLLFNRFIYNLYFNEYSNLTRSWVYGGEYESFSQLVKTVSESLIAVGLKLYFVFDGQCVNGGTEI
jgi:hypothetical protein